LGAGRKSQPISTEIDLRQLALIPLAAIAAPALAEEQPSFPAAGEIDEELIVEPADENEIVVVASRLVGSVDAPQPPLVTLDEEDIASYGASSVTELIEALGTQTTSSRGRGGGFPIMLINGQRISSFREMRNLPPEAIRRMEVLPEEVALRYGYPPNQRVVNMILKDNFSSKTVEVEYHRPTGGGFDELETEASLFQIAGKSRLNLTVTANDTSPLTEAERGIQQNPLPIPGDPNPADFRTLVSDSRDFGFNGTWTTPVGSSGAGLTLNAAASTARSTSYSGLVSNTAGVDPDVTTRYFTEPLRRRSKTDTYQGGLNFINQFGDWRMTTTVDASTSTTTTLIDRRPAVVPAVPAEGPLPPLTLTEDRARSRLDTISSLATLIGRPLTLPAGDASFTVKAGFNYTGITSSDTRSGVGEVKLDRKDLTAGVNLGLPLTSRDEEVLGAVGDITLNLSGGINHLSDFGTLFDYSAGITWGITDKLNFQASYIVNEAAPSLTNLGNPRIETPFVSVFDFTRNETAFVTLISGGNPDLLKERQRDLKLSANWQLPFLERSSLQVEYIRNNSDDVTQGFPLLTPAIEAAFPDRVARDADGRLVEIDQRPVTFDTIKSSRIRYGFNIAGRLGKAQEPSPESAQERRGPGGRRSAAGRRRRPRWRAWTWRLRRRAGPRRFRRPRRRRRRTGPLEPRAVSHLSLRRNRACRARRPLARPARWRRALRRRRLAPLARGRRRRLLSRLRPALQWKLVGTHQGPVADLGPALRQPVQPRPAGFRQPRPAAEAGELGAVLRQFAALDRGGQPFQFAPARDRRQRCRAEQLSTRADRPARPDGGDRVPQAVLIDIVQVSVQIEPMQVETFSRARANLKAVMDRVVADHVPVTIARQSGENVVMVSESDWASIEETLHLLSSPRNAARLMEAVQGLEAGGGEEHELIEP
jgi:iron complex outermembrane recepter protein